MKALIFGEVIWDVYPDKSVIGGAPFNFAAHVSHLGMDSYLITGVGDDKLGEQAVLEMKKHGIKTDFVLTNTFDTGKCTVTLDENKVPSYFVHTNTAYDNIVVDDDVINKIKELDADVFYFNTLIQRNDVSRKSLEYILKNCNFNNIFCDINIRKDCFDYDSLKLCMEKSTIVKISDEEAHYLYDLGLIKGDDVIKDVAAAFPNLKQIVYTRGGDGSCVYDRVSGNVTDSGTLPKTEVVSTVGAGDCYGATYIAYYLGKGASVKDAIDAASKRSAIVVASLEAVPF
jgi:fructokinase